MAAFIAIVVTVALLVEHAESAQAGSETATGSEGLEPRLSSAALSYVAVAIIFGLIGFIFGVLASLRMGGGSCVKRSRRI